MSSSLTTHCMQDLCSTVLGGHEPIQGSVLCTRGNDPLEIIQGQANSGCVIWGHFPPSYCESSSGFNATKLPLSLYLPVHYTGKAATAMLAELHFSSQSTQSTLCTSIFFRKYMMLINGSNGFGWHNFTLHSSDLCPILLHK